MAEQEIITLIKNNNPETGMEILKKYGNERKRAGSKSLAKLVRDMRFSQKHTPKSSGKLEEQVDRAVDAVLGVK